MSQADYNKGGMIAFALTMIGTFIFFGYLVFLHPGVDLQEVQPMAEGKGQTEAFDPSQVEEPWKTSEALVGYGQKLYKTNCAFCHGDSGRGDGPAGAGLNPPPRDLVKGEWTKGGSKFELFQTISKGIENTSMAAYGHLPEVDRWALVHYVQSITENHVEASADEQDNYLNQRK